MRKSQTNSPYGSHSNSGSERFDDAPKSARGERPAIEVRILEINAKGKLEELSCYPLSYYGSCPNVGDTIVDNTILDPCFYSVQRRYFVKESILFAGWALIVRKIDPAGPPLDLWEEWQDATRFWDDVADQEEQKRARELEALTTAAIARSAPNKSTSKPKPKIRRKKVLKPREQT